LVLVSPPQLSASSQFVVLWSSLRACPFNPRRDRFFASFPYGAGFPLSAFRHSCYRPLVETFRLEAFSGDLGVFDQAKLPEQPFVVSWCQFFGFHSFPGLARPFFSVRESL